MPLKTLKEVDFYGVDNHYFKIGKQVFLAEEDANDGYRSMMESVDVVASKQTKDLIFFRTPIAKVKIIKLDTELSGNLDGYRFIDVKDQHLWLEIGTERDGSGYYPTFVFRYYPKAQKKVKVTTMPKAKKEEQPKLTKGEMLYKGALDILYDRAKVLDKAKDEIE